MRALILDFYGVIFDPATRLPMMGVLEFLQLAKQNNISCAIASSTDSHSIQDFLDEHNLAQYIQTVIGADKVIHIKPDPECYVQAAKALQVEIKDCTVIDDSLAPLENAKVLGFQIIHFTYPGPGFSVIIKTLWVNPSA